MNHKYYDETISNIQDDNNGPLHGNGLRFVHSP